MSSQVLAKKSMVLISFALFSLIFVGLVFALETSEIDSQEHTSYLSWLVIAYVAGLSMIVLPCTLPLVFMNCSTPGLPVHHQLPEFTQTHIHQVSDAIQPSHPLASPSPPAPNPSQHQNSLHEVAKVLEFQL